MLKRYVALQFQAFALQPFPPGDVMAIAQFVTDFGYPAVFVGTVLEGETILLLAAFAAHQGYLSLPWVIVFAMGGGMVGDQLFFFIGRRYGRALLSRFPKLRPGTQRVSNLMQRHSAGIIIGVRFMYGLRVAGPIAIGMSEVSAWRFILLNMVGAALWASVIAGAGFLFGKTLQWLFADIQHYEKFAVLFIIVMALLLSTLRLLHLNARGRG